MGLGIIDLRARNDLTKGCRYMHIGSLLFCIEIHLNGYYCNTIHTKLLLEIKRRTYKMTLEEGLQQTEQGYQLIVEAQRIISDAFINSILFTWQWWLCLALTIIPWVIWFRYRTKESSDRLLYAGFTVIILSFIIDHVAVSQGIWSYPINLVPLTSLPIPFHISLVPVIAMFFIQVKPNVNPFIKAVIFAAIGAFAAIPLFGFMDIYNAKGWPSVFDFIILLVIYTVAHWFSAMKHFDNLKQNEENEDEREPLFTNLRKKEKAK
jgi:hypothetical protein